MAPSEYVVTISNDKSGCKTNSYPISKIEDLFTSISSGKSFFKVDLAIVHINKLYQYNCFPFGVASAFAILFQRALENILQGTEHVYFYLDDILVIFITWTKTPSVIKTGECRYSFKTSYMCFYVSHGGRPVQREGSRGFEDPLFL